MFLESPTTSRRSSSCAAIDDTYLYVARPLDPRVVEQLRDDAGRASPNTPDLEARRFGVQVAFALMYTVIALIVLLSAVWIGLNFANRLVAPIRRLIGAANVVSTGNLYVQVPVRALGGRSRPARRDLQQDDAGAAHPARRPRARARRDRQPPPLHRGGAGGRERRRDRRRRRRPHQHPQPLGREADRAQRGRRARAQPLAEVDARARAAARRGAHRACSGWCRARSRSAATAASATCRCASPPSSRPTRDHGYVVTLDDITDLVAAQRTSAWADVARRIAHEIKNPLTPIQLSAERLRRKYGKVDHRGHGGVRAVHRHDRPPGRRHQAHGRRVLALRPHAEAGDRRRGRRRHGARRPCSCSASAIPTSTSRSRPAERADAGALRPPADLAGADQHRQERHRGDRRGAAGRARPGPHHVSRSSARAATIVIDVIDNGIGLPKENRNRLLEPYVTTREKGTGLGLAIVGKILEEHGGGIELHDARRKSPRAARRVDAAALRRRSAAASDRQRAGKANRSGERA